MNHQDTAKALVASPWETSTPYFTPFKQLPEQSSADFCGRDMPVQFSSIIAEHEAAATWAALFDLCHMGRLRLNGPGALAFLDQQICRPLASMQIGQVRYGY